MCEGVVNGYRKEPNVMLRDGTIGDSQKTQKSRKESQNKPSVTQPPQEKLSSKSKSKSNSKSKSDYILSRAPTSLDLIREYFDTGSLEFNFRLIEMIQ